MILITLSTVSCNDMSSFRSQRTLTRNSRDLQCSDNTTALICIAQIDDIDADSVKSNLTEYAYRLTLSTNITCSEPCFTALQTYYECNNNEEKLDRLNQLTCVQYEGELCYPTLQVELEKGTVVSLDDDCGDFSQCSDNCRTTLVSNLAALGCCGPAISRSFFADRIQVIEACAGFSFSNGCSCFSDNKALTCIDLIQSFNIHSTDLVDLEFYSNLQANIRCSEPCISSLQSFYECTNQADELKALNELFCLRHNDTFCYTQIQLESTKGTLLDLGDFCGDLSTLTECNGVCAEINKANVATLGCCGNIIAGSGFYADPKVFESCGIDVHACDHATSNNCSSLVISMTAGSSSVASFTIGLLLAVAAVIIAALY